MDQNTFMILNVLLRITWKSIPGKMIILRETLITYAPDSGNDLHRGGPQRRAPRREGTLCRKRVVSPKYTQRGARGFHIGARPRHPLNRTRVASGSNATSRFVQHRVGILRVRSRLQIRAAEGGRGSPVLANKYEPRGE